MFTLYLTLAIKIADIHYSMHAVNYVHNVNSTLSETLCIVGQLIVFCITSKFFS